MLLVRASSTTYTAGYCYGAENEDLSIKFVNGSLLGLGGIRLLDILWLGCMMWDLLI